MAQLKNPNVMMMGPQPSGAGLMADYHPPSGVQVLQNTPMFDGPQQANYDQDPSWKGSYVPPPPAAPGGVQSIPMPPLDGTPEQAGQKPPAPAPTTSPTPQAPAPVMPPPIVAAAPPPPPLVMPQSNLRKPMESTIQGLLSGDLNKDIVNRRTDNARDLLNKQRKSSGDTLGALLADSGQNGGSAESGRVRLDEALGDDFASTLNEIFANEGAAADSRMMGALGIGRDLDLGDMENAVRAYEAQTGRQGVLGDYDLGSKKLGLDTELGRADVGLRTRAADLGDKRLGLDTELGRGALDVDKGRLDLDKTLGTGRLDLDKELGRADVGLRGRQVDQGDRRLDLDKTLGEGDLDVRKRSLDITDANNKGQLSLGNRNADIDERLGNRQLDLTDQGQHLDWDKFLADLGFRRDSFGITTEGDNLDRIIELLRQRGGATNTSSNGRI